MWPTRYFQRNRIAPSSWTPWWSVPRIRLNMNNYGNLLYVDPSQKLRLAYSIGSGYSTVRHARLVGEVYDSELVSPLDGTWLNLWSWVFIYQWIPCCFEIWHLLLYTPTFFVNKKPQYKTTFINMINQANLFLLFEKIWNYTLTTRSNKRDPWIYLLIGRHR